MLFYNYPSIGHFRHAIKYATHDTEDNKRIIDYIGSVKLHGTNGCVVQNQQGEMVVQSRNRVLTIESDNAGFATFIRNVPNISSIFQDIRCRENDNTSTIAIYGEWCGSGIQKGVSISKLPKMWVIFDINIGGRWLDMRMFHSIHKNSASIYNIMLFPVFYIKIDFNKPEECQEKLIEITSAIESECPVGKFFNKIGTGEGVVWKPVDKRIYNNSQYWFKVKGVKHCVSRVKTLKQIAPTAVDLYQNMNEFVERCTTQNRFEQGISILYELGHTNINLNLIGEFMRWVVTDITKEEKDTIEDNCWDKVKTQLNKLINRKSKDWFVNYINSL